MIYYNDELVNWKKPNPDDPIEQNVANEIAKIREQFFADGTRKRVIVEYPDGKRKKNSSGYWEPKRTFPLDLRSSDHMWRYTESKPSINAITKDLDYHDSGHLFIKDEWVIEEDKIELVYFLMHQSPDVQKKKLFIQDREAKAKQENEQTSKDVKLAFYLFDEDSPLNGNGNKAFKDIAIAFGIDITGMGIEEIKREIHAKVIDGENFKDKFVNLNTFRSFVKAEKKLDAAVVVRNAIEDGSLFFDKSIYAWKLKGEEEVFLKIKGSEQQDAVEIVINKVVEDPLLRNWLMMYTDHGGGISMDELKKMTRPHLLQVAKRSQTKISNGDKNDVLIEKIATTLGLLS